MKLVGNPDAPRLITNKSGNDLTEQMNAWAESRVEELASGGGRTPARHYLEEKFYRVSLCL